MNFQINRIRAKIIQKIYRLKIDSQYHRWYVKNKPNKSQLNTQSNTKFPFSPKISIIVPVYNVDPKWLELCIKSVLNQTYTNWQLCLADDCSTNPQIKSVLEACSLADSRIHYALREQNGHISAASNTALEMAEGEFVGLLDHDDELSPHALYKVVELLNLHKNADFIYSDEDKIDMNGQHIEPAFKPSYSPDMLLSTNYICHFSVIRKKLIDKLGGFRLGVEGSQDYDLFLRLSQITQNIYHIPDILYHWRKIPGSTAAVYSDKSYANNASLRSLTEHLQSKNIKASVENGLQPGTFRVKYSLKDNPLVSIIIPTKDKFEILKNCINSILTKSTYSNYEIILIDTGSTDPQVKEYYRQLDNKKIKILEWNKPFNFSSVNNFGVTKSRGEYLVFLNNDTEVISPDWIECMLEHAQRPEIGAVGCKLLYPDNTLQHAGVFLGVGGIANHSYYRMPDLVSQPFPQLNSKDIIRNFLAVTGACLMVSRHKFNQIGGFDPEFTIAYNDIDLCLKLHQKGYRNLYTPYSKLFHYESTTISQNRDQSLFNQEQDLFKTKWQKFIDCDPYYNPNLTITTTNCSIRV